MLKLRGDERTPVLAALVLTMALVAMDTTILATAVPQVVEDLGGLSDVGWVFSVYLLADTVTIPIYGKLSDLHGRKPILLIGVVLFLVGSALSAGAWNMGSLIAFRAFQGIGAGAIAATVQTVAGDIYTVEERGQVQGYLASVWGVSALVAPALGGVFAQYLSWRWIFLVNIPIGLIALTLIWRGFHETVERRRHDIDYLGAGFVLVAAGALIVALLEGGGRWAWTSAPILVLFAVAVAATLALPAVERRAAEPVLPPWLWHDRRVALSCLASGTAGMSVIGLSVYLPTWGQTVLDLSPVSAGFVLATMSITWPIASSLSAHVYMRIGFRDTALAGAVAAVIATAGLSALSADAAVWQPVACAGVMGVGMGLTFSPLMVGLQNTVGWNRRGTLTGGLMYARYLGQSIGAAAFGAIANVVLRRHADDAEAVAVHASTHAVFVGLFAVAVVTLVVTVAIPRWRHVSSEEPAPSEEPSRHGAGDIG